MTQLVGVRETMKALKEIEPQLQRDLTKRMRNAAKPLRAAAQAKIPGQSPMSGWTRGRYAFDSAKARRGIKTKVGGRTSSRKSVWPLVALTQSDAGGAVFEVAGRRSSGKTKSGRQFIANLNKHGSASRAMWKAAENDGGVVEREVVKAIKDTAATINRKISTRRW